MKQLRFVLLALCALCSAPLALAQDPWRITAEQPLQGDYYGITSANGQIGLISSREPLQVNKLVVGGLYDLYAPGRVNNYFPNINPLDILLTVDGTELQGSNITDYTQQMNLHNAAFTGVFDFGGKLHAEYTTVALRQMPFGFMTDVTLTALADCNLTVTNRHRVPDNLPEPQAFFSHIKNKANSFVEHYPSYYLLTTTVKSPSGRHHLAASTAFLFPDSPAQGTPCKITHDAAPHTMAFEQHLAKGDTLHFCVVGNVIASNVVPDTRNEAERLTVFALLEGYDRLLSRHNKAWDELWQSDIIIEGDPQAQQDIHSMLYHLYAFFREGNAFSCSPMGLSGQGYNGHTFWDGETWMFPPLLMMQPTLAAQMIQYRFDRLPQARNKAFMHGYRGALFPWESADSGQEETAPNNMYPALEHHVTADVAIACWQYYCVTHDKQWLAEIGYPILRETADFWVSRVEPNGDILNLIGADEWNSNRYGGKQVNNNAYTIGAARTNLTAAAKAAAQLKQQAVPAWQQTADRLHYSYLPDGIIAEHNTYHGEVTKQADVVLLAYPLHELTDKQAIAKTLAYYIPTVPEKKTPAMSKSIYATLYARIGEADKALHWWRDSYLPNLNPPFRVLAEFNGGTNPYFITGAGGTLQALLFGFAGLDITDKGLKQAYKPILPDEWTSLTIRRKGQKDIKITK